MRCNLLDYILLTTAIVLQPLQQLNSRLHTNISRYPWAKLWYALRALDSERCGYYEFPLVLGELVTGRDEKTIYRWLKEGKRWGAFRFYRTDRRRQVIEVGLGGLEKVCQKLNIRDWGKVAELPLLEVTRYIRPLTTAITTQALQQQSRYAANLNIKKDHRQLYGAPHPNELLPPNDRQPSLKSAAGKLDVPFVLHRSETRLFVSKSFCHFGTSQERISRKIGIHPRTVQRHHTALGLEHRQICQKKSEYGWINRARECDAPEYWASDTTEKSIGYQVNGEAIAFHDGIPKAPKKQIINSYNIPAGDFDRRFFKMGRDWWINRCNVYREDFDLTTMRAARRKFKEKLAKMSSENCHSDTSSKIEPVLQGTI